MTPVYGPGNQIVSMGACYGINYFDGATWRLWNRPAVPGDRGSPLPSSHESPFPVELNSCFARCELLVRRNLEPLEVLRIRRVSKNQSQDIVLLSVQE